jgi:hypothetical protein
VSDAPSDEKCAYQCPNVLSSAIFPIYPIHFTHYASTVPTRQDNSASILPTILLEARRKSHQSIGLNAMISQQLHIMSIHTVRSMDVPNDRPQQGAAWL